MEHRPSRPTPTVGDTSSAADRRSAPQAWAMGEQVTAALQHVIGARRDIRRFRPDEVPQDLLDEVLKAGHNAPSVGHSQPWRFIVVRDQRLRDRAAHLADRSRLEQAAGMTSDRAARLLDLKLEGLREAPLGVIVACDRRTPAAGVLGRATFPDTDMWSCACAVQNMWLTARALGLGMGWVTLFEPSDLQDLLGLPDGVETLGWMCLGWPDELPPEPGLQRAAWSRKLPLEDVVLENGWPQAGAPRRPASHLAGPTSDRLTAATDSADALLSPPEALGVLDRVANRVTAIAGENVSAGTLVLAAADHPVVELGVTAFEKTVTRDVALSAADGRSLGAAHATSAGLGLVVVDAGVDGDPLPKACNARTNGSRGDLASADAMTPEDTRRLVDTGRQIGANASHRGLVCLGEVGVGNTTVASALAAALVGLDPDTAVGLGAGSDADIVDRKRAVVRSALARLGDDRDPMTVLGSVGGPEIAVLAGVVLGAADAGAPVVLDGLATSVAALLAVRLEPAAQGYLVAGQRSREHAHEKVLAELGLEPLLELRLRAGEGIGACLAAGMILQTLRARRESVRTS